MNDKYALWTSKFQGRNDKKMQEKKCMKEEKIEYNDTEGGV